MHRLEVRRTARLVARKAEAQSFIALQVSPESSVESDVLQKPQTKANRNGGETEGTAGLSDLGMRIVFQDLTYLVRNQANKSEKLALLKQVSGYYIPGEMAAVMGPSGSGKSTHLDILAGRKTVGDIKGTIHFGGQKPTAAFLKRFTGYVEQFDTLLPELTVQEMLMYTAELKCPTSELHKSKRDRVEKLMKVLALTKCRDTFIGDALSRGISGGQAKRTNVGIALITNPRILFLDEPTSGLDSFTAHEVMSVVKTLVNEGITIVATIHCPPPHTFRLFDRVLILQQGSIIYFGLNGKHSIDYFYSHFDNLRQKTEEENLAEWLVDVTSEAERMGSDRFVTGYSGSTLKSENDAQLRAFMKEEESAEIPAAVQKALAVKTTTTTPMWKGLEVMLKYRTRNNYKSWYYLFGRLFDKSMFTLFTFLYFWKIGKNNTSENTTNVTGLLFTWAILPAWGAGPYLPAIVLERPIFVREVSDGLYTAFTYLVYKMIEEVFMAFLMSIPFNLLVFYLCALQGSFIAFWITWLVSLCDGIALAYAVAAVSPTMDIANCVLLTFPTILLFGCGYLIVWNAIPRYVLWLSYLSWLQFAWAGLMINQYQGVDVTVFGDANVLEYFSLNNQGLWASIGYEALFFIGFLSISWAGLTMLKHQRR